MSALLVCFFAASGIIASPLGTLFSSAVLGTIRARERGYPPFPPASRTLHVVSFETENASTAGTRCSDLGIYLNSFGTQNNWIMCSVRSSVNCSHAMPLNRSIKTSQSKLNVRISNENARIYCTNLSRGRN